MQNSYSFDFACVDNYRRLTYYGREKNLSRLEFDIVISFTKWLMYFLPCLPHLRELGSLVNDLISIVEEF